MHRRAYRWDLWTAFGIAIGGADGGEFRDAICWLILRGRRAFTRTLVNPDALSGMDLVPREIEKAGLLATAAHSQFEVCPREEGEPEAALKLSLLESLGEIEYSARRPASPYRRISHRCGGGIPGSPRDTCPPN
ncbi:DUF4240 domain-containing protein [Amycolatopsis anabasis]|uniref:DUF4240 domain-containing protein n=1 Tax=Amycolatopsis anabasis TaxID=1840409 RepID=UPI00131D52A1|nr:DUF4240 domain-containing protein [Amycolatopsis anabasis]